MAADDRATQDIKIHHIYLFIPEYSNPNSRSVIFMRFVF